MPHHTISWSTAWKYVALSAFVAAGVYGTSLLLASPAQAGSGTPLAPYRDRNRVILIFAPGPNDARYQKQITLFNGHDAQEADRDLVRFSIFEAGQSRAPKGELSARDAQSLRAKYQVRRGQFRVLLVGKDGHTAYGQVSPVEPSELFGRIDRMPMRRDEMRRKKS